MKEALLGESASTADGSRATSARSQPQDVRDGSRVTSGKCLLWRLADESARRTPLLRTKQHGMLQFPHRRQRLEQIIKLKRAGLTSREDRLNDVGRDQGQ